MFKKNKSQKTAELIVRCLEKEGVEYIFGLPGEENIELVDALIDSNIRFILTRHEQGASFMADIYGRLTRKAGVCLATLGPGAINLILGVTDANLDSSPVVALIAQASLDRLNKESHQVIDLKALFEPVTKWVAMITLADSTPEIVRKAFKLAQSQRSGATAVIIPEDVVQLPTSAQPLLPQHPQGTEPNPAQIARAAEIINQAKHPVVLAGHGICRNHVEAALVQFVERSRIPTATTFMAKGVISDQHEYTIGTLGFMRHDYTNLGFDKADVVITVGYDLIEYPPRSWNPDNDKQIIHINSMPAEVDSHYVVAVGLQGKMVDTLNELAQAIQPRENTSCANKKIRKLIQSELDDHANDDSFPLKPQRIVHDMRAAMGREDIVLCDTGALKMWVARLYPCYYSNTCLISNSLATMAFSLPGALGAKLAHPERKVLAVMGDGSFLMNSQELETAKRENIPFVVLVWVDHHYGLIKWKQELELGRSAHVEFNDPDFVKYAESFGIRGYRVNSASELLPALTEALASDALAIIECPVDYSENTRLTDKLGKLTATI